jgi:hypothetical protein
MFSRNVINPKTANAARRSNKGPTAWAAVESKHDGWEAVVP